MSWKLGDIVVIIIIVVAAVVAAVLLLLCSSCCRLPIKRNPSKCDTGVSCRAGPVA